MSRRNITWAGVAIIVAAGALLFRSSWRFADELRDELLVPPTLPPMGTVEVLEVGAEEITLALTDTSLLAGTWGLRTAVSYGRMGDVTDSTDATITRTYEGAEGLLSPGEVAVDLLAYQGDPHRALAIPYEGVQVQSELGPMPAWLIAGSEPSWVIFVHGAGGRAEALRSLNVPLDLGYSLLVISYRNDPGAAAAPDGLVTWGFDEWQDVEAGVELALAEGAEDIFLMGSGLGGSAVIMTLLETAHIRSIRGAVLDSPVLDLATVDKARRPDSGLIGSWGRTLASLRFGVEWSRLNHVASADELSRPVLLFHGSRDEVTPVRLADAFAVALGEGVEYHRSDEAGHGSTWNVAPDRYEAALRDFLIEHTPSPE
jgi:pimeloyl-ACP methyl ester carboxylesterase